MNRCFTLHVTPFILFFLGSFIDFSSVFFFLLLEILALRRVHHHVHDTRRYIVTLIWLFAPPYPIIGKQQIKWKTKKKKKKWADKWNWNSQSFQHCLFTKQRLTQEFTEEKFNRQQRFGSSVRSWSDGQTNLNILFIYILADSPWKPPPYICFFFQICAIMQTRNRVKRNRRARPVGLYKGQRLAAI